MPTLDINGTRVSVDDSFLKLSHDEQNATVNEIAASMNAPKGSSIGGVAKSLGTGVAEGAIGLAGLPGDLTDLGSKGIGAASNFISDKLGLPRYQPKGGSVLDNIPTAASLQKNVEGVTGEFYKPQGTVEDIANKIGQFAPAMIGGPETLATKALTRVAAPALASEAGGAVAGPYGEFAGALAGGVGATAAARKFQEMAAARTAANSIPTGENLLQAGGNQFNQARDMNLTVKPDFATNAAADMREALKGFDPEAQGNVFKAAHRLAGLASAKSAAPVLEAATVAQPAKQAAITIRPVPSAPAQPSLLQFLASKGGLGPDAELAAIGGEGHTVNVDGLGRRKLVRQGGLPLDYAREAAQEAGYLSGTHNGTSTVNDLLDAIDGEMRGRKVYPQGFEGTIGKGEAAAMSEREQHDFARHMQGFEDDLSAAGHGQLGPDVKERAVQLMANKGMDADTAVENALHQLEQQDNAVHVGGFPGDRPAPRSNAPAAPVQMNDIENIRKQLTFLKMSPDGATREAARTAIKSLQKSQMALVPEHVISGDAGAYTQLIKDAVDNYAAGKRSNAVTGKADLAELNSGTAGSGANQDNNLRQAIKQLARPINNTNTPVAKRLGFNDPEIAAIKQAATGTLAGNTARYLGKLAPTGSVSALVSGEAGHMVGGLPGAIALPAAGYLAKKIGDLSTKRAVSAVDSLVRSRSPLAAQVASQLPPQIVQQLSSKSQRLLQSLILADPTLAQQQRQPVGQSNPY